MKHFRLFYKSFEDNITDISGVTGYNVKKDSYTVLINTNVSESLQFHTLKHELSHILLNHFFQIDRDLEEIENEAEQYADRMSPDELDYLMTFKL